MTATVDVPVNVIALLIVILEVIDQDIDAETEPLNVLLVDGDTVPNIDIAEVALLVELIVKLIEKLDDPLMEPLVEMLAEFATELL